MSNRYLSRLDALPKPNVVNSRLTAVSLFSGGGGLDLGLHLAGFRLLFACDIEQAHCDTIQQNFPDCIVRKRDVVCLQKKQILEVTKADGIDLLAGGPPCQAFSILGQRNSFSDPRGGLVFEYIRLVKELQPRAFVFENVPGLLTLHAGADWQQLLDCFRRRTEYAVEDGILNAADFGIPQIRRRVFVVGLRGKNGVFDFPAPTHRAPDSRDVGNNGKLPAWLPAKLALTRVKGLPNQRIRPHTEKVRLRYTLIRPGKRDRTDHTDRIHPERPSGTVLVGSKNGGGRPFIHPYEDRHITVREAARLQSFPDWYVFAGTNTWQYRAVGNAVPPLLAMSVGMSIRRALEDARG